MELICIGDSITYGYGTSRKDVWTEIFAQKSGWKVTNLGICGDTTGGMLARMEHDVMPGLRHSHGECRVIIMGGSNDILFSGSDICARSNIAAMAHQLMAAGVSPLIGLPLPIDGDRTPKAWRCCTDFSNAASVLEKYKEWLKSFCSAFNVTIVQFDSLFSGSNGRPASELMTDGIHPNARGHRFMADLLFKTLINK